MPSWVSEGSVRKYHRAIAQITKENADRVKLGQPVVEMTEEAIKTLYVKWGGYVVGDASTMEGNTNDAEVVAEVATEEVAKKRGRKTK